MAPGHITKKNSRTITDFQKENIKSVFIISEFYNYELLLHFAFLIYDVHCLSKIRFIHVKIETYGKKELTHNFE